MTARLYVAEHVFPGHPDKLCDTIADRLVEEAGRREKRALVGVEVAVHRDTVFVTGRIACLDAEKIDVSAIVRGVYTDAGYGRDWPPVPAKLKVRTDLALEPLAEGEAEFRAFADDQSIVTGYAIDVPGTNYLPPEHWLAWKFSRALQALRETSAELQLGPDGKVMVGLEQQEGGPSRLESLSVSLQQSAEADQIALHRAVREAVERTLQRAAVEVLGLEASVPEQVRINGAGEFAVGGPRGDNGLSGKKLVVDAYGPRVPIGGGALCGKDLYKADRAGAIMARRMAKAVVVTGVTSECTATLSFQPGTEAARVVSLQAEEGREIDIARWSQLIDLRLAGVGDRYTGTGDFIRIAKNGHFLDPTQPWERVAFDPSGLESGAVKGDENS